MRALKVLVPLFFLVLTPLAQAKNVILFISDGMGQALLTATRHAKSGPPSILTLETFPYTALVRTHSADCRVTDSAAAATALACGQKTNNEMVGQDATGVKGQKDGLRLVSLAEQAKALGYSVGLVSNTKVTHATPAAFFAHVNHRYKEPEIVSQFLESGVDVCLSGGRTAFSGVTLDPEKFYVVKDKNGLRKAVTVKGKRVLGLFADDLMHPVSVPKGMRKGEPSLAEMTEAALEILSENKEGFFLMVEGGLIDGFAHANDAHGAIVEVLEYDKAIARALKRVSGQDTLVISVSDHEPGGVALNGYPGWKDDAEGTGKAEEISYPFLTFSTGPKSAYPMGAACHSGVDVTAFGWGFGAERIHGTLDNTELQHIALEVLKEK